MSLSRAMRLCSSRDLELTLQLLDRELRELGRPARNGVCSGHEVDAAYAFG